MDDEGVVLRTALGLEDMQDGSLIQGVGPEAVDRLGGDAKQAAGSNDGGSGSDIFRCRFGEINRFHIEFLLN